jgi:hypothetical protein
MYGSAVSLTEPAASPRDVPELLQKGRTGKKVKPTARQSQVRKISISRTASSAVCPVARQRTSLDSQRNQLPSRFDRRATSLGVCPARVSRPTKHHYLVRTPDGQSLAAMRAGAGLAGAAQQLSKGGRTAFDLKDGPGDARTAQKEFSCQKNWLFPRPPMNGGSRLWKKVS